jgi:hypothetical protein
MRILVVEDDPLILEFASEALGKDSQRRPSSP